ncbi:MAG: AbrB/MazE/SpoVT family DNA-binding domain-containing protein [Dehalococcoidia bacterium]|nr:AbrB/MazE/SpoVT family DNA-binding domain-containing protein [Dehalococcoidia bacterium]
MGAIFQRTIGVVGGSSLMITLPKAWLKFHHLAAGDKVEVVSNGRLVIRPIKRPKGKEDVEVKA